MVTTVQISIDEWDTACLEDRAYFNNYLIKFIGKCFNSREDCNKTIVMLPSIVTKAERYCIHKFTVRNHFIPESDDDSNGNRIMGICLSRWYVQQLLLNYVFVELPPPPPPLSDKQILFRSMMQFIEDNLQNELHQWLENI